MYSLGGDAVDTIHSSDVHTPQILCIFKTDMYGHLSLLFIGEFLTRDAYV